MLDWIAMGKTIGAAIDAADQAEQGQEVAAEATPGDGTAEDQGDRAEPGGSCSNVV